MATKVIYNGAEIADSDNRMVLKTAGKQMVSDVEIQPGAGGSEQPLGFVATAWNELGYPTAGEIRNMTEIPMGFMAAFWNEDKGEYLGQTTAIEHLGLPDTLVEIEVVAFSGMIELRDITIPAFVTHTYMPLHSMTVLT